MRQLAPAAFRAEQFRAVTEADYTAAARKLPEVAGAVASFRWTGSWYTVFVGIDPRDPEDLITVPGGRTRLAPGLERRVRAFLTRYRLAGYDLEIRSAEYVPLEIEFELCVEPDYFRGDVAEAVRAGPRQPRQPRRPPRLLPPRPLHLRAGRVPERDLRRHRGGGGRAVGVPHRLPAVRQDRQRRAGRGVLPIGPWEIARLDNDPNFMENGVLRITAGGGK